MVRMSEPSLIWIFNESHKSRTVLISVFSPVSDTLLLRCNHFIKMAVCLMCVVVLSVKNSSLASSLTVWYTLHSMHMTDGFNKCQRQASKQEEQSSCRDDLTSPLLYSFRLATPLHAAIQLILFPAVFNVVPSPFYITYVKAVIKVKHVDLLVDRQKCDPVKLPNFVSIQGHACLRYLMVQPDLEQTSFF